MRSLMIRKVLHFWMALLWVSFSLACTEETHRPAALVSRIKQQYGVSIEKMIDADQLPRSSVDNIQDKEVEVQFTPPTVAQFYRCAGIVSKALKKYPPALVKKHLNQIWVGGQYRENGGIIAGMYEKDKLFLFYNHKKGDNSDLFLEQTLHHEFSSLLIKFYNFPAFHWLKLNPADFDYIINPSGIKAYMNAVKSYNASEAQLNQGLVSGYGKANAENDINSYVELIFTKPETMKTYIRKYSRIASKYQMIKRFYLSVSPEFSGVFSLVK